MKNFQGRLFPVLTRKEELLSRGVFAVARLGLFLSLSCKPDILDCAWWRQTYGIRLWLPESLYALLSL